MTVINTATEDELSEVVATKLINDVAPNCIIGLKLRKGGNGYLFSRIDNFRRMAYREYVLLITDLDRRPCAPGMIAEWSRNNAFPDKLIFRVAVREIEAWLLADRPGIAAMLGVSEAAVPTQPDTLEDPKQTLLNLARGASREVRGELLAPRNSLSSQGLGYNRTLAHYVNSIWDIERACDRSPSLRRAVDRLRGIN